ncbi:energy transducer TonB [Phenylobacterium sp. VNQ135]|uniref:energy transducer TonB n=1 Tax=Phenylobacterium sp. VNQ135 TaxID=3400922 RepID=UPI003C097481
MRAVVFTTLAAVAVFGAAAAAADVPDPRLPMWSGSESAWMRAVQRRLEGEVDHSRGVGQAATAEVRFQLGPDGRIAEADLVTPSGSEVLDELALQAVRRTRSLPLPPEGLTGRPVRFRLQVTKPVSLPLTW